MNKTKLMTHALSRMVAAARLRWLRAQGRVYNIR